MAIPTEARADGRIAILGLGQPKADRVIHSPMATLAQLRVGSCHHHQSPHPSISMSVWHNSIRAAGWAKSPALPARVMASALGLSCSATEYPVKLRGIGVRTHSHAHQASRQASKKLSSICPSEMAWAR